MYEWLKNVFKTKSKTGVRGDYVITIESSTGVIKSVDRLHNLVPNQGLTELLKIGNGQATATNKYIGLGTATYNPSATETGASVSQAVGEWVGYNESARQQWIIPAITSTTVDNSATLAVFTSNSTATLRNVFVSTNSAKGSSNSGDVCWSVLNLPQIRTMTPGDVIRIQYGQTLISQ